MKVWLTAFAGGRARAIFFVQLLVLLVLTIAGTLWVTRPAHLDTPEARAEALQRSGRLGAAERVFWEALGVGPVTVPLLVDFLDNHHGQRVLVSDGLLRGENFLVAESDIDSLLARSDIPEDVRTLGRFWRASLVKNVPSDLKNDVIAFADRNPPTPFANRLLGYAARRDGHLDEAAARLEREARFFPERREDLVLAMRLLAMAEAWDEIGQKIHDPAISSMVPPQIRYAYAVRTKDYKLALRATFATALAPRPRAPLLLAGISGFMWLLFALRMGRAVQRPWFRVPLFLTAFGLGVLSVVPTLVVIGLEETLLHFHERGDFVSDLIFFTVGVGLREEVCKLLLFLPLLPVLRKWGTRLDVLACGTLVGLGFATEENVGYFQSGLSVALSRFLTANFLHMALTALLALAVYDLSRDTEKGAPAFSRTLLTVVAIHGAYDFFLSNPQVEGLSFLSMTIFVILTRMFMSEVLSSAKGPGAPLLPRFTQAVMIVTAASYVYAASIVGPTGAAFALAQGMLGIVVIMIMFFQELRRA